VGDRLRLLNARNIDEERFNRQIPMLTHAGQAALRGLRVAVVGGGGTGSHAITLLAYLGIRDFLLLDDDVIETTNLNRVVTAETADIDTPKTLVAKRRILALDPDAAVQTMPGLTPFGEHPELLEVDLIVGCVDHDGPRHRLNELAVEAGVPYIDIGTGVDANIDPPATGARVAFGLPGGPCLGCTDELDPIEVARWYKPAEQQNLDRAHGYGTRTATPSVVHLNGLAVNAAVAEIVAWITGARPPARRLDIDLDGDPALPGTRVAPSSDTTRRPGCVVCSWRYPSEAGTSAA
jgi:molybdopterin/thiamine biosynthesis adenylyltransferase